MRLASVSLARVPTTRATRARASSSSPRARVVTARAVAELRVLAEFCVPLVRVGGHWVSAKNADVAAEAEDASRAVETLGGGPPLVRVVDVSSAFSRSSSRLDSMTIFTSASDRQFASLKSGPSRSSLASSSSTADFRPTHAAADIVARGRGMTRARVSIPLRVGRAPRRARRIVTCYNCYY